jgi:hypothetical protein
MPEFQAAFPRQSEIFADRLVLILDVQASPQFIRGWGLSHAEAF